MNKIHLEWEGFSQEDWETYFIQIPRSNAFQDWSFGEIIASRFNQHLERCLIKRGKKTIGLAQIYNLPKLKILTHRKLIRGPIFLKPPMPEELIDILTQIKKQKSLFKGYMTDLMPELPNSDAVNRELSKDGFHKILSGYQSIWIDLKKTEEDLRRNLHSKWRNQLSKSEHEEFNLDISDNCENWLLENTAAQKEAIGYHAMPSSLFFDLPPKNKMIMTLNYKDSPCASALFQIHGQSATYQLSYSDDLGKRLNAMNLLLWEAMKHLKQHGISNLDLGGIEPDKNPSLARFKERMGGESFTLAGNFT